MILEHMNLKKHQIFMGRAIKGDLGKEFQSTFLTIPCNFRWGAQQAIKEIVELGQQVANGQTMEEDLEQTINKRLQTAPEELRDVLQCILQKAGVFGRMTDEEIQQLILDGGWKD